MAQRRKIGVAVLLLCVFLVVGMNVFASGSGEQQPKATVKSKAVINFWTYPFEETTNKWWEKWVGEFNKANPNIEVKFALVPGDAWEQKIKAAQAAGTAPDVITINYNKIAFSAQQGQLKAMDEYVNPKVWLDLYPNINEFVTVKGKHYAYPKLVEPSAVLFYRTDMFKAAGLDPNKPPKNWAELIDYGKKLTTNNVFGLLVAGMGGDLSWTSWGWQGMMGHFPISNDWSKATVTDAPYQELVTLWKTMYDEKIVPKQALAGYPDIKPFGEGRAAMAFCGSWALSELRNTYSTIIPNLGIAVAPTPDGNQNRPTASLGGWTLAIDGLSKYPKEAGDFITWVLAGDPAIMVDFFRTARFSKFSPRKSVDDAINKDPEASKDPFRKLIAEKIIPYAIAEPLYAWDISMSYANAVERVILKSMPVDESLKIAEKEINDYIQKNSYAGTNPK